MFGLLESLFVLLGMVLAFVLVVGLITFILIAITFEVAKLWTERPSKLQKADAYFNWPEQPGELNTTGLSARDFRATHLTDSADDFFNKMTEYHNDAD